MEDSEISKNQREIIDIVESILVKMKVSDKKKTNISFKEAIKKLYSLKYDNPEGDLRHFIFFAKSLFLDEKGKFDFEIDKLREYLNSEKGIKDIFDSLLKCIQSNKFIDFLLELGGIVSDIYFDEGFNDIISDFEHTGINSYEFLFQIFAKCKKSQEKKYIRDNYDIYYSQTYMMEISYDLVLSMNLFIQACISSPNFDNLSEIVIEDINSEDSQEKKDKNIKEIELHILKCLRIFWTNSNFFLDINLDDFMNYFYDFITLSSSKHFILENPIDDNKKKYLEHMSFSLENLFIDFNANSVKQFELCLFEFVKNHKNENIEFVERALSIGRTYPELKEEDIGLISMICYNNNFIEKMKELAKDKTLDDLQNVIDKNDHLLKFEILILSQIFQENAEKKNKDEKLEQNDDLINNNNIIISETEQNKEKSEEEIDLKKIDFSDYENDKTLNIQLLKKLETFEKEISILQEKEKKKEKEISILDEKDKKIEKEISILTKKIDILTEIHQKIYFRDVSKYYIKEFARINKINGNNTFDICQNILNFDFSKSKDKNMKEIIVKIITHYLNENKFAQMEYFISKSKPLKKHILAKDVENSYMEFMKFKQEETVLLGNRITIINAPFVYYH